MSLFRLDDKVSAVTGAGAGIGASIARLFAAQGARVALLERDGAAGERVAREIAAAGGEACSFPCDVSVEAQVERAFADLLARFGGLDVLVNNAGIAHVGTAETTSEADLDRVYAVNVKGIHLCTRAALPALRARGGGVILNLASIASLVGLADRFAYSMSKGAVLTMTRSVAVDYMKENVRCNCVCPARVHTPFVDGFLRDHYPGREREMFEKLAAYQPMGRMGRPEEVAALALYL